MAVSRKIDHELFEVSRADSDQESMWDGFKFGANMDYFVYENDFFTYAAGDWTVTETQGGQTQALTDEVGGVLKCSLVGDSEDDVMGLQLGAESFLPAAGKEIWFECRVKVDEATQSDFLFGLSDTDTAIPGAQPSDGIYFYKADGSTSVGAYCTSSSVSSSEAGVNTYAAAYVKLGFRVKGVSEVDFWVNDVKVATIEGSIPTTELRVSLGIADGDGAGGADYMYIDYVKCAQTR